MISCPHAIRTHLKIELVPKLLNDACKAYRSLRAPTAIAYEARIHRLALLLFTDLAALVQSSDLRKTQNTTGSDS